MKDLKEEKRRILTPKESEIFVRLCLVEEVIGAEELKDSCSRIIRGRTACGNAALVLWLSYLSSGVPGRAAIWAHQLHTHKWANLDDWTRDYPDGIPESYDAVWDSQKISGANWLDTAEAWA